MKSKLLSLTLVALAASLLCGCVLVPKTHVKGTIAGQPFNIVSPKDSDLEGLDLTCNTNGAVTLHITRLKARMNPDVVGATAAGQSQFAESLLNGSANIAGTVTDKAIKAYMAYLGVPPKPDAPAPVAAVTETNAPAK